MALDRWLLEQHAAGNLPPILRFYSWNPIALSLGYHQRRIPGHWHHFTWRGQPLELVRRPSGGRAVLHQGDLTYALVASGFEGSRMQVYRELCEFLIRGWRSLSIDLHFGDSGRGYIHNPNCFGTATAADLVRPDGTKLIGSAQLRRDNTILQHGSMRLNPDPALFATIFETPLRHSPLPIPGIQAEQIATLIPLLTTAAEDTFGISLVPEALSSSEYQAVQEKAIEFSFIP
ncbi:lipoyl protein ligase domain-containing protein [Vacuolonema iberomarrocanum]|uniref:lipoyl protein ligase domain-containing protein n=1 Tax=Vacuolonema iberomarrocanum TaxID=3454632 RepID=UPI0019E8E43B|nr:lipoate--protein ligase family protein [filamentous cyanobacterium LEGE 07170]